MLINGFLKQDELNKVLYSVWYEPAYQWYFSGRNHYPLRFSAEKGDERHRCFASVDSKDNCVGCMGYSVDHDINSAWGFYAIRFHGKDKLTFGRDLRNCLGLTFP